MRAGTWRTWSSGLGKWPRESRTGSAGTREARLPYWSGLREAFGRGPGRESHATVGEETAWWDRGPSRCWGCRRSWWPNAGWECNANCLARATCPAWRRRGQWAAAWVERAIRGTGQPGGWHVVDVGGNAAMTSTRWIATLGLEVGKGWGLTQPVLERRRMRHCASHGQAGTWKTCSCQRAPYLLCFVSPHGRLSRSHSAATRGGGVERGGEEGCRRGRGTGGLRRGASQRGRAGEHAMCRRVVMGG